MKKEKKTTFSFSRSPSVAQPVSASVTVVDTERRFIPATMCSKSVALAAAVAYLWLPLAAAVVEYQLPSAAQETTWELDCVDSQITFQNEPQKGVNLEGSGFNMHGWRLKKNPYAYKIKNIR